MSKTIFVNCPACQEFMEINTENGKILRHQPSKTKGKSKEQAFLEALDETKERERKLTQQFDSAKDAEKEKLKKLEEKFRKKKGKIDSGVDEDEGPVRPFDLD